jgi:hypothetical protein
MITKEAKEAPTAFETKAQKAQKAKEAEELGFGIEKKIAKRIRKQTALEARIRKEAYEALFSFETEETAQEAEKVQFVITKIAHNKGLKYFATTIMKNA